MEKKKPKYDEHLKKILRKFLNDRDILKKEFEDLQSFKDYLIVYTVDEFIFTVLKVTDAQYKGELHRILKPHVKKLFNSEFKDLIKARFDLLQNKKKLNEDSFGLDRGRNLDKSLRLVRSFLDDSSYKNNKNVVEIGARLPRFTEDNIVVTVFLDKRDTSIEPSDITDSIYQDLLKMFGIKTYVQYQWI